ncbi:MAG: helix-turn-helix domain-containing protein, partial [Bradyrhizobium sp.]
MIIDRYFKSPLSGSINGSRAHRISRSPQCRRRAVSAIAFRVGFGHLSSFNRCFQRFYGFTPRDIREAAASE